MASDRNNYVPVVSASLFFLASLLLAALPLLQVTGDKDVWNHLVGWVCAPVGTLLSLGFDRYVHSEKFKKFPTTYTLPSNAILVTIKIVAFGSLVPAIFHIYRIAYIWSAS